MKRAAVANLRPSLLDLDICLASRCSNIWCEAAALKIMLLILESSVTILHSYRELFQEKLATTTSLPQILTKLIFWHYYLEAKGLKATKIKQCYQQLSSKNEEHIDGKMKRGRLFQFKYHNEDCWTIALASVKK